MAKYGNWADIGVQIVLCYVILPIIAYCQPYNQETLSVFLRMCGQRQSMLDVPQHTVHLCRVLIGHQHISMSVITANGRQFCLVFFFLDKHINKNRVKEVKRTSYPQYGYVTCIYLLCIIFHASGNMNGNRPYIKGSSCSQCPSGYTCNNGLCRS